MGQCYSHNSNKDITKKTSNYLKIAFTEFIVVNCVFLQLSLKITCKRKDPTKPTSLFLTLTTKKREEYIPKGIFTSRNRETEIEEETVV